MRAPTYYAMATGCGLAVPRGFWQDDAIALRRVAVSARPEVAPVAIMSMRVLIIEDDPKVAGAVQAGLTAEGCDAVVARTGEDGYFRVTTEPFDALLLDIGLPGRSGLEVLKSLRGRGLTLPVLVLTARDAIEDRVLGLDSGADDYLVKPFAFAELLARLRALARRGTGERPAVVEVGELRLDPATRRVWRGDSEVHLSGKEFALLETFMRRPGQVLTRLQLLEHAWDYAYENRSNVVDVYVRYLRAKFGAERIETIRGMGYRLL